MAAKAKGKRFKAQAMIEGKGYKKQMSGILRSGALEGSRPGVADSGKATPTRPPLGKSSWRRSKKRVRRVMQRRPGQ